MRRTRLLSDHGWNLHQDLDVVRMNVAKLKDAGIRTSIFMDPTASDMSLAHQTGTDRIELYTEQYADSYDTEDNEQILAQYQETAVAAQQEGLAVNAGHDLNLDNLEKFLTKVADVKEVSIGHAVIIESLDYGFISTLQRYLEIIDRVNSKLEVLI